MAAQRLKVGVVQAAGQFLDREASIRRACGFIEEAGLQGIAILGFPEGFVPAHPVWYHYFPASSRESFDFAARLFDNSVEVAGPDLDPVREAAARAGVNVVLGVCERRPRTTGTLFNTQVFIDSTGRLLGKHQKLTPTLGERLVHAGGWGDGLRVFETPVARVGGLICGENSNQLASFALAAQGAQIHVASWPNHFAQGEHRPAELVSVISRGLAYSMGAFVLSACGVISESMQHELAYTERDKAFLADLRHGGGSVIVGPDSSVLAGPMEGTEEGILSAEIDLEQTVRAKHIHDYAGHYNRSDVFTLRINRRVGQFVDDSHGVGPFEVLQERDDAELSAELQPAVGP
jgi:aliphatic nitrilase